MRSTLGSACKSLALAGCFVALTACSGDSAGDDDASTSSAGSGGSTSGASGTGGVVGSGGSKASTSGSGGTAMQASGGTGGKSTGTGGASPSTDAGMADAGSDSGMPDAGTVDAGTPTTVSEGLVGWAAVEGDGDDTTTGGLGGTEVTPGNAQELIDAAKSADARIIHIHGSFTVPVLDVASNKTLIGDATATIEGGIRIHGDKDELVHNVVIKNLRVHANTSGVDKDGIQVHYAHHVWIDHCEVWDAADGNLDIVHKSNWVTVSWTKFHYTSAAPDQGHRFCNLVGHSDDNASEDNGRLKVTFHHDWWAEGVIERMPRVRFGQVHVFNNYYSAHGNYGVGAAIQSRLLVENNVFDGMKDPHKFYLTDGETRTAEMVAEGNLYPNTTGLQDQAGSAFMPPYPYELDPASAVAAIVMAGAGPR